VVLDLESLCTRRADRRRLNPLALGRDIKGRKGHPAYKIDNHTFTEATWNLSGMSQVSFLEHQHPEGCTSFVRLKD